MKAAFVNSLDIHAPDAASRSATLSAGNQFQEAVLRLTHAYTAPAGSGGLVLVEAQEVRLALVPSRISAVTPPVGILMPEL